MHAYKIQACLFSFSFFFLNPLAKLPVTIPLPTNEILIALCFLRERSVLLYIFICIPTSPVLFLPFRSPRCRVVWQTRCCFFLEGEVCFFVGWIVVSCWLIPRSGFMGKIDEKCRLKLFSRGEMRWLRVRRRYLLFPNIGGTNECFACKI